MEAREQTKQKYLYLEALRAVCIYLIICNHTPQVALFLIETKPEGVVFWLYVALYAVIPLAVPCFFAISGALLLNERGEILARLWKKKIPRYFCILLLVSLVYYAGKAWFYNVYNSIWHITGERAFALDAGEFIGRMYSGTTEDFLWFLPLYIGYLMSVPFLRALAQNLEERYYFYLFALAAVFTGLIPMAEYRFAQDGIRLYGNYYPGWLFGTIVFYPLIGYYLHTKCAPRRPRRALAMLWGVSLAALIIQCRMLYYDMYTVSGGNWWKTRLQGNFLPVYCVCLFLTFKVLFEKAALPLWMEKLILSLGRNAFFIYLTHQMLLWLLEKYQLAERLQGAGIPMAAVSFIIATLVFVVGYTAGICFHAGLALLKKGLAKLPVPPKEG